MATTRPVLLRVRNVCDNSCREIQNMYFILSDLLSENRVIYEKMWKNMVGPDKPHMAICHGVCELHDR